MNSRTRDLVLIATAMLVILGCGFGFGHRVGARGSGPPPEVPVGSLEEKTLVALRTELGLTPEQEELIRGDLQAVVRDVFDSRERTMLEYHLHMVRLHDRIAPKLDQKQQEILMKNRERLQLTIEKRFSNLLQELKPGEENGEGGAE